MVRSCNGPIIEFYGLDCSQEVASSHMLFPEKWNVIGNLLFRWDCGGHMRNLAAMTALMEKAKLRLAVKNIPGSFPYQRAVFIWKYDK